MAQYVEQPFVQPYTGSIADLITRPADARAAAIRAAADAQARAAQQSGAAWGNAIQGVGQTIAAIPEQMQAQQKAKQETALRQDQLDQISQQKASQMALSDAIKSSADPTTGKIDHEAVAQKVSKAGFPGQAEAWLKMAASNAENLDKLSELTRSHQQHQLETIGDLAYSAKTPEEFTAAVGLAAGSGLIPEDQAHQIAAAAAGDGWQSIKAQYQMYSPRYKAQQAEENKPITTPEGAITTTPARAAAGEAPLVMGTPKPPPAGDFKGPTTNYQSKSTGNPAIIDQHTGDYLDAITHQKIQPGDLVEVAPPRNPDVAAAAAQVHADAESTKRTQEQTQSYNFHTQQVDKVASPVEEKQKEFSNLRTLLDQHTPQADADVAPKLLTAFAGGQGSGLRMNQATIDRNAGGHTAWVGLQQTLNRFSTDPTHASIPEAQRQQIYQLLGAGESQIGAKTKAIDAYRNILADPNSTTAQHRQGLNDLHKALNDIETGSIGKANAAPIKVGGFTITVK